MVLSTAVAAAGRRGCNGQSAGGNYSLCAAAVVACLLSDSRGHTDNSVMWYDRITQRKQQRAVEVVVWSGDRSQAPIKASHSKARTCHTRMVPPAAAGGRQGY